MIEWARPLVDEMQQRVGMQSEPAALDEVSGATVYDVTVPELEDIAYREKTGTLYKNRLAMAHETGSLAIFGLADGRLVSLYKSRVPLSRTAGADGRLFVGTGAGSILVFDEWIRG